MSQYEVKTVDHTLNCSVSVPGSKSITNRALLMAALGDGVSTLEGALFSDDSRYFLSSLVSLGFVIESNEVEKEVIVHGCSGKIPKKEAEIYVGSAGTAARFLTTMLAFADGTYTIRCSDQMKKRPMKQLFDALTSLGAEFTYLEKEGHLPVVVKGTSKHKTEVTIDTTNSTQFLSALLMTAPMSGHKLEIHITGDRAEGAYVQITTHMMTQFGVEVKHESGSKTFTIPKQQCYSAAFYRIEPDVSAACYFYAAAAILGGSVTVNRVYLNSMQGDKKFLSVLEQMGCKVTEGEKGVTVTGPESGKLQGITVDMEDFSDQSMTLAAIAPFAEGPVHITHIGHIRLQESDRITAIVTELKRLGIHAEDEGDAILIRPGEVKPCMVTTYNDHRMAMSFALIGLREAGIVIDDYECCGKTFENYFEVLEELR